AGHRWSSRQAGVVHRDAEDRHRRSTPHRRRADQPRMDARAQGLGRQTMVEQEMTRTCARPGCTEPGIIRIETKTWLCSEHVNELVNSPENIRANTAFEEMAEHLDKREAVVMTGRLARRTAHHGALAYLGTNARAHTRNSPIWQSAPSCAGVPCPAAALE